MFDQNKISRIKDKAEKYFLKGKFRDALSTYTQLKDYGKDDPRILLRIGDISRKAGDIPGAVESYKEAADIFVKSGFLIKAVAVCKLILTVDPSLTDIEKRLAELYARSKPVAPPVYESPPDAAEEVQTIGMVEPPAETAEEDAKAPEEEEAPKEEEPEEKDAPPEAPAPPPGDDTGLLMGNESESEEAPEEDEEDTIEFELVADQAKAEVERIEQAQAEKQEKTDRERAELEKGAQAAKDDAKRLEDEKRAGEEKAVEEHKRLEQSLGEARAEVEKIERAKAEDEKKAGAEKAELRGSLDEARTELERLEQAKRKEEEKLAREREMSLRRTSKKLAQRPRILPGPWPMTRRKPMRRRKSWKMP